MWIRSSPRVYSPMISMPRWASPTSPTAAVSPNSSITRAEPAQEAEIISGRLLS